MDLYKPKFKEKPKKTEKSREFARIIDPRKNPEYRAAKFGKKASKAQEFKKRYGK